MENRRSIYIVIVMGYMLLLGIGAFMCVTAPTERIADQLRAATEMGISESPVSTEFFLAAPESSAGTYDTSSLLKSKQYAKASHYTLSGVGGAPAFRPVLIPLSTVLLPLVSLQSVLQRFNI